MINYIRGDLLLSNHDIIAHGVNCRGVFNAGVAKAISLKYPQAKQEYIKKYNSEKWHLGDNQIVKINEKYIVNMATQLNYGYGSVFVDYNALEVCFKKLYIFSKNNNLSVAIPKIGSGLAGGNWNQIEKIINSIFIDKEIFVYFL